MNRNIQEVQWVQSCVHVKIHIEAHYNQTVQRQRIQKAARVTCHIPGGPINITKFLIRNFGSPKSVDRYIQSAEEIKLSTKNPISDKTVLQRWGRN